jgi:catechol 2,3-dioxygenase-like lactoylglutathione lyase family enzyme
MSTPFRQLHHICLVVHDIDAAQEFYESVGVGPWKDYPPLTAYTELETAYPDAFLQLKYRVVDLANVQLQLCQPPLLDCPQRRFLDTHGVGVFHIGFEADLDTAIEQADALGVEVLMRGRRPNGSGFVYFDTAERAGVVLLARKTSTG